MAAQKRAGRSDELWRIAATAVSIMVAPVCTAPHVAIVCYGCGSQLHIASTACVAAQDSCLTVCKACLATALSRVLSALVAALGTRKHLGACEDCQS